MKSHRLSCVTGVILLLAVLRPLYAQTDVPPPALDVLWQEAAVLESRQRPAEAADRYAAILAQVPDSQNAAFRLGYCLSKAGKLPEALAAYDKAVAANPTGYLAGAALYYKAQACADLKKAADAQACVERLRATFPESSYVAQAAVVAARVAGADPAAAEAALADETAATVIYAEAARASSQKQDDAALALAGEVIARYPNTPAALRALDMQAHLLLRTNRRDDAYGAFLNILGRVGDSAPDSRIVQTAQTRLAALLHASGQREQALAMYLRILEKSSGSAFASRAALQVAGLDFELLHRRVFRKEAIPPERWEQLRALCWRVLDMPKAKPAERSRAHVLIVESFCWQGRPEDAVAEADRFLQLYQSPEFKQDIATVRFFAGEELLKLRRYDEALAHFRWITDAYQGQKEIWPGMDHLPRTFFRIWETLRRTRRPTEEIKAAADALLEQFPDSAYAKHCRTSTRQDAQWAAWRAAADVHNAGEE